MKLHYTKILLFFFPLNILLTSYHAHNKNKPYITSRHRQTSTSRVLSESDPYMLNYDNDDDMKSVKENFDRQTSQRFEEYEGRMKDKRRKCKEQCDKDIQEIILKDKMEKSLAEKVEIGCLRCGCGLGGVAASVGIFGTVAVKELAKTATAAAVAAAQEAVKDAAMAATIKAVGAAAGKEFVIAGLKQMGVSTLDGKELGTYITATNYTNVKNIAHAINTQYEPSSCLITVPVDSKPICTWVRAKEGAARVIQGKQFSTQETIKVAVTSIVSDAENVAAAAEQQATKDAIKASTLAVDSKYAICQNAIIASVVALLIIVLIMIIIYLVLRYRRKKKMKKKAEYTKLLNQ
ncbi:rifin [Plasmodium falciparum NF54]|uniref:Rifin n=2 Tax=Plasmodium falciparum TaxID=5833 RepID=O96290_PLAF7|nr:rifin [Plasmodium falciparum 3D7]KAF4331284.1 rifin [Plasmodium falciparum NF54]PKC46348.1 rifin [Plasmodium falciparum NF54]CZT98240.1 rifin [Plasmodium falciparum 3D7]|eukprot:XP_001349729.1 rifin [Plasmodium falciparum 3D7]